MVPLQHQQHQVAPVYTTPPTPALFPVTAGEHGVAEQLAVRAMATAPVAAATAVAPTVGLAPQLPAHAFLQVNPVREEGGICIRRVSALLVEFWSAPVACCTSDVSQDVLARPNPLLRHVFGVAYVEFVLVLRCTEERVNNVLMNCCDADYCALL